LFELRTSTFIVFDVILNFTISIVCKLLSLQNVVFKGVIVPFFEIKHQ
jgi:hypothetical protein